ncbi:RNA-directed DNA polymerase, eukaryota, reverse transcriptase zinc-binding domain protein [Tanacetum coccineum]
MGMRGLNGIQFPPINGMGENGNENIEGSKECLDKSCNCENNSARNDDCVEVVNEEQNNNNKEHEVEITDVDEEVVGRNNVGSQSFGVDGVGMRFADMVKNNKLDNKLLHVPTEVSGNEDSIMIFDDEIIELRSQKWSLTVFGHFIGCSMGFNEDRYHIRRMWYRFGLKDVIAKNGVFYFKFQDEESINEVINNGPWMVNNKPLVSVKEINALASSIRKPVIMDEITTKMCVTGVGRIGFARVLVGIDAEKGIKDKIEIIKCGIDEGFVEKKDNEYKTVQNRKYGRDGYNMYRYSNRQNGQYDKMWNDRRNVRVNTKWQTNNRFEYRRRKEDERKGKGLDNNEGTNDEANGMKRRKEQTSGGSRNFNDSVKEFQDGSTDTNNRYKVKKNSAGMLATKRIYSPAFFVDMGMNGWTEDMKRYYRDRKELFNATKKIEENEDVMEEQKEVKKLIKEEGLQFCAILETHVKYKNIKKNYGRMECYFDSGLLISKSRQYMFFLMDTIDRKSKFFCTMIYASNSGMERRNLWKDLEMQKIITNGVPWVILGDFNVTLKVLEHSNGGAYPASEMIEFQDCINNIELVDLHSEGFHFTWTKSLKNPKCGTLKKLDRIMVNEVFIDKFQQSYGLFLPYMISDHSPIVVKMPNGVQKRKGSFRFSNLITDKKDFLPTVRSVWNKEFEGHTMYRVVQKMKHLKRKLKQMSWKNGDVFERAEQLMIKVKECQADVDRFPHDENVKEKSWSVLKDYQEAIQDEYSLLCQKPKVEWLKEGDRNTAYFHKTIKKGYIEVESCLLGMKKGIQRLQGQMVILPGFTNQLGVLLGRKIFQVVKEFFLTGKLLGEVNATLILLVPKVPTPDKVSDLRPIACCNVLYKCISKILTSRIKGVLGKLVGENQSAFIEGRQITDNILLSQERFKGYNRKQNIKKVSFKINLQKAYDTISWDFLKEILEMFGFYKTMVSYIMTCVTSTKFSINVNGERVGYLKGDRGFRQGDPISPYLFTLVIEVLNLLIQKNIDQSKVFKYHYGCKNLKITHMCFIGDLLVFCHGDPESVKVMKKSLNEFSGYSGLLPNLQKSTIFLGVIYEINKLLKGFLWCQCELTKGKAKVSWDKIYKPKDQGGLGLKNLGVWSEVLMIEHLWNVAVKKDTFTVGWKNILSLRDKVRKHIGWKLGNGKFVNIWYDKWCSVSPLSDFIDTRDIYDARLNNNCTVSDLINEGRWKWPAEWSTYFVELSQLQVPILNDNIEDTAVWISENGNEKKFKISNVWKDMNCQEEKVDWHHLVWFAQSIPRHAFVTWLAIQERLMTQDKLMLWRQ